jgi:hypothetical protein
MIPRLGMRLRSLQASATLQRLACSHSAKAADHQFRLRQAFKRRCGWPPSPRQALFAADDHQNRRALRRSEPRPECRALRPAAAAAAAAGRWERDRAGECGPAWRCAAGRPAPGQRPAPAAPRLNVGHHIGAGVLAGSRARALLVARGSAGRTTMARHSAGGATRATCTCRPSLAQRQIRPASRPRRCPDGPPARCLFENALGAPIQLAKMHRQGNGRQPPRRRRAAAHPQRNLVVHANRQRNTGRPWLSSRSLVNLQDEVVFEPGTALPVAARCGNRELRGRLGLDLQIKIQGHGRGVKAGAEIGGGGGQAQPETARVCSCNSPFRPRSSHSALQRGQHCGRSGLDGLRIAPQPRIDLRFPATVSSSFSSVPRWKSMV